MDILDRKVPRYFCKTLHQWDILHENFLFFVRRRLRYCRANFQVDPLPWAHEEGATLTLPWISKIYRGAQGRGRNEDMVMYDLIHLVGLE